jgi:hypothetical protein
MRRAGPSVRTSSARSSARAPAGPPAAATRPRYGTPSPPRSPVAPRSRLRQRSQPHSRSPTRHLPLLPLPLPRRTLLHLSHPPQPHALHLRVKAMSRSPPWRRRPACSLGSRAHWKPIPRPDRWAAPPPLPLLLLLLPQGSRAPAAAAALSLSERSRPAVMIGQ